MPTDATANQLIRLTLSNSVGQVYRDFAVGTTATSVASLPIFAPPSGTYSSAQSVTISDSIAGASIYYTTDGSTPTTASAVYTGPINLTSTGSINAIATAPGYSVSAVASAMYTISIPVAATPALSLSAGTYSGPQSVTISDSTPGAIIYYTTDGSTPTTSSSVYSAAISVSASETIQAMAAAPGYTNSGVAAAAYTINTISSTPLVNYSSGFASSAGLSLVNRVSVKNGALVLTDGGSNEARAAWYSTPVNVQSFNTSFTFQLSPGNTTADGFTFVVQNAPSGAAAVGGSGGALGYKGLAASVAVKFDLYNNAGEGSNSTGFYTKGVLPEVPAWSLTPAGLNLHSGDLFSAQLSYDGTTLHLSITDLKTSRTFSTAAAVNIPGIVGSSSAYVGFTAGTGKLTAAQKILSWTYSGP